MHQGRFQQLVTWQRPSSKIEDLSSSRQFPPAVQLVPLPSEKVGLIQIKRKYLEHLRSD